MNIQSMTVVAYLFGLCGRDLGEQEVKHDLHPLHVILGWFHES